MLESSSQVHVPPGQHLLLAASIGGEWVVRPYSPTHIDKRRVELLVKVYEAQHSIPAGRMSTWLRDRCAIGDELRFKAPCGHIAWTDGRLNVFSVALDLHRYSFVAGGTGITPVYAMIRAILTSKPDAHARLLYSNKTEKDILLASDLEQLAVAHADRFQMCHVITTPDKKGGSEARVLLGRVNRRMVEEVLFAPAPDSTVMICGPPGMMEAVIDVLEKTGYTPSGLLEF